jgi:predicted Zn finger-like uncharacterized protein
MIEVQCTSCHTRYRVDEQVLPEGTPTFKCSRCGHVFSIEPRTTTAAEARGAPPLSPRNNPKPLRQSAAPSSEDPAKEREAEAPKGAPFLDVAALQAAAQPGEPTSSTETQATPTPSSATKPQTPSPKNRDAIAEALFGPMRPADSPAENENFSFDFSEEQSKEDDSVDTEASEPEIEADTGPHASADWKVGDVPEPSVAATDRFHIGTVPLETRRTRRKRELEEAQLEEAEAPLYNRRVAHSSRFFLGLFAIIVVLFGGITLAIRDAPAPALEGFRHVPIIGAEFDSATLPGRMIALNDVRSAYIKRSDGHTALVIQGIAHNVSQTNLHQIAIGVRLRVVSGQSIARRQVFCGNNPDGKFVPQMTPHEIEFFQSRPAPNDFTLIPGGSCSLMAVFIDPPSATRFDLAVTQASPATPPVENLSD